MKARAVVPPFLPLEEIQRRVGAIAPDLDVVTDLLGEGRYKPEELEVLVVTAFTSVTAEDLPRLASLKYLQVASTGYNNVPLAACQARGIRVLNIPGANAKSVAEHVIMMVLALQRDLVNVDKTLRSGEWPLLAGGSDLGGKVFGILGMGRIGKEVARRLVPFEVATIYWDIVHLPEAEERALGATFVELPELLASADILSLHLPVNDATRGLLNEAAFASMKEDVVLVNCARAELVDGAALRKYVGNGKVRLGTDVYASEPPDFSDELFRIPSALFTPHSAGVTREAQERILAETVKNVLRIAQGKEPLYEVKA